MKTGKQNLKEGTDDWAPHVSGSPTPSALPCPARTPWPWPWPRAHRGGAAARAHSQDGQAALGRAAGAWGPRVSAGARVPEARGVLVGRGGSTATWDP